MKKKILIIFVGLSLGLFFVEVVLRLLAFGYNFIHPLPSVLSGEYTIFCVGESTTWGTGASDPLKKGYPKQLEEMLNKQFPDKKIDVVFDKTIGQNTSEILLKFPGYIKKYQPKIIIFMVGANNWWNLDRSNILLFSKNGYLSNLTLRTLIFLDKFRTWKLLKWMAYSYGWIKEKWNYALDVQEAEKRFKEVEREDSWDIFFKIAGHDLDQMIKISKTNKIKTVICSYPYSAADLYYIQKEVAFKNKVPFVDNFKFFEQLPDKETYFAPDGVHPNDKGYRLTAGNIYNCILENQLIKSDFSEK